MKNLPYIISAIAIALTFGATALAATPPFTSAQLSPSATNGYVLQTNGSANSWVATSTLGIVSGVSSFNTRMGAITLVSGDVTTALGFTPYNATNPSGYISNITGLVTAGTNVTITGSGTSGSPYVINSSGGGSGSGLSTTTPWSPGQLSFVVNNSTVSGVSTTTHAFSGPFTVTGVIGALVGGSNSTVTWNGLATTSQPSSSNILVSDGSAGVYGSATSTLTASSPLTGSFTQIGLGGSLGCQTASGSQAGCLSSADWTTFNVKQATITGTPGQFPYFSATNTLTATSSIFLASNGNIGVGTTSPYASFSIMAGGSYASSATSTLFAIGSSTAGTATSTLLSLDSLGTMILNTASGANDNADALMRPYGAFVIDTNPAPIGNFIAPASLHVNAINLIGGDNSDPAIYISGVGNLTYPDGTNAIRSLIDLRSARGSGSSLQASQTGDEVGRISGHGYDGTQYTGSLSAVSFYTASNITPSSQGGYVTFRTAAIGTVPAGSNVSPPEVARIQPNGGFSIGDPTFDSTDPGHGILDVENNVGIGTTSPYAALSVSGNFVLGGNITATSTATSTFASDINIPSGRCYQVNGTCITGGSSLTGTTGQVAYFSGTNTAVGTSSLSIATSGNIGIGSTSPTSAISLQGSATPNLGLYTSGSGTIYAPQTLSLFNSNQTSGSTNYANALFETKANASGATGIMNGIIDNLSDAGTTVNQPNYVGLGVNVFHVGNGTVTSEQGLNFGLRNSSTGTTVTLALGATGSFTNNGIGATTTTATGLNSIILANGAFGAITNANGLGVTIQNSNANSTITNATALNISGITNTGTIASTTGIYIGNMTAGTQTTHPYGIYQYGPSDYDYFGGSVGIATTSPGSALSIQGNVFLAGNITATSTATSTFYGSMNIGSQSATPLVTIGSTTPTYGYLVNDRLNIVDARNDYVASNVYNLSPNICATADVTEANDLNSTALNFFDMGHTSSGFTGSGCANNPFTGFHANSSYLFDPSGYINFALGSTTGGAFNWFTGGYAAANQKMTLTNAGLLGVGTSTPWRTLSVTGTVGFDGLTSGSGTALCLSTKKELVTCTGGSGTVTSVATDATLTGGTITTTGTLGLNLSNSNTWTALQNINSGTYGTAYKQGLNLTQTNNFLSSSYSPALTLTGDQVTNSCTGTAVPSSWSISNKTFPTGIANGLYSNLVFDSVLTACGGTVSTTTALSITNTATGLFVGIGTSTPFANLSVSDTPSTFSLSAFAIGSSTAAFATTTLFAIDNTGHVVTGSPKGSLSSCGTTNSLNGNDNSGTIMLTGTLVTACTLTFANPTPANQNLSCTSSDVSTAIFSNVTATTTTSVTFGLSGTVSTATIFYHCDRNVND